MGKYNNLSINNKLMNLNNWKDSYRKQLEIDDRLCIHEMYDLWLTADEVHAMSDIVMKNGQGFIVSAQDPNRIHEQTLL